MYAALLFLTSNDMAKYDSLTSMLTLECTISSAKTSQSRRADKSKDGAVDPKLSHNPSGLDARGH